MDAVSEFETLISKIEKAGHIMSAQKFKKDGRTGVELFLNNNMPVLRAKAIEHHIKTTFGFDVCFYVKKNSIKIVY